MTLETLNYIHELLVERETILSCTKNALYEAKCVTEYNNKKEYLILCDTYSRTKRKWEDCVAALEDFEEHNWS